MLGGSKEVTAVICAGTCVNTQSLDALEDICEEIHALGFHPVLQVFVRNPTMFKDALTVDQKAQIRALVDQEQAIVVVHGAYISAPWGGAKSSLYNIMLEAALCEEIGSSGYILHLAPGVINRPVLAAVLSRLKSCIVWFEINAVKSSSTSFETPEKLAAAFSVISEIADELSVAVGLCIDTAHLFAAGVSFREYE